MTRRFLWIQKALFSHYWRHPWQTLFLLTGLISGVGLWSGVQIINHHAQASYLDAQQLLGAQASYWIKHRRGEGIEARTYIDLRRQGYRQIFPVIELEVSTPGGVSLDLIATDLLAIPGSFSGSESTADSDQGFGDSWLQFIQPPYQSWIPAIVADELNLLEGQRIELRDGRQLPPARIRAQQQQGRRILLDIGAALSLSARSRPDYLVVGSLTPGEYSTLADTLPPELELIENQQHIDLRQLTSSLHSHLTAMSLLSFAVGLFIVFNAVRFSLWYRRTTLLNLRMMGCAMKPLIGAIAIETLAWSLIGTALGFALGVLVAQALLPAMGSSLQSLYNATVDGELGISGWTLLQAWSITLAGLVLALAWPLYRQLSHSALEAGGSAALQAGEQTAYRRLAIAALLLAVVARVAYPQINSVTQGFIVLGVILFAAAWSLPLCLAMTLRLLAWILPGRHLLARWMVSDGWAQLPTLRSAMTALLLALTANLGVGTLVDSFRDAFVGWLEVRQSADIYLRTTRGDIQHLEPGPNNADWLADSNYRIGVNHRWRNRPALIRGIDPDATDSRVLPLSAWQGSSAANALKTWREQPAKVLVNEQLHFLAKVQVGDLIQLENHSAAKSYEVVGIFYDYGNPYFQFYLPRAEVVERWPDHYSRGIALWLNASNPSALDKARKALKELGAQPGDWITREQIRGISIGIFDRTFAITAAMNLLTMIVAAIALLASLLAILHDRMPQFAQWRALGVHQNEQWLLMATPLLIFCGIVWLMSLPLGALLSWILIHKLNIISFGWSMPLVWNLTPALWLGLLVLLICVLALLVISQLSRRQMPSALAQLGETP
jgi:putative ABC transport system permease protein